MKQWRTNQSKMARQLGIQLQLGRTIRVIDNNTGEVWDFDKSNNRGRYKNEINHAYAQMLRKLKSAQLANPPGAMAVSLEMHVIDGPQTLEEFVAILKPMSLKRLHSNY